jgi:hypothetical protein
MDERRQLRPRPETPRGVVVRDRLLELIGKIPAFSEPAAYVGVRNSQDLLFRLADIDSLRLGDIENLAKIGGEILTCPHLCIHIQS